MYTCIYIYIYIYCEWLTEVASSKTVSPANVPMGPTAHSKPFVPAAVVSNQKRWIGWKVELATAMIEIGHDLSSRKAKTLHSHHGCKKATYPWADHSHVSAEMQMARMFVDSPEWMMACCWIGIRVTCWILIHFTLPKNHCFLLLLSSVAT